uniref:hypothetical protein n=1 Tax=Methylobacterium sp. B34 TaxID=95563 RepID=UPI00165118D0
DAAREAGEDPVHVYLPQSEGQEVQVTVGSLTLSFPLRDIEGIAKVVALRWGGPDDILLTGVNGAFSMSAIGLQRRLKPYLSFYDLYDDVRFGRTGFHAAKVIIKNQIWRMICNFCLVHNPDLIRNNQSAIFLDTASHVVPKSSSIQQKLGDVLLYTGSIDERTDFDLMESVLKHGHGLHVYGRTHGRDPEVASKIEGLSKYYRRFSYFGPYENDEIAEILGRYKFGLVPYKTESAFTRYINPHKIYHYLNAGLEVFTTRIPFIRFIQDYVHIIDQSTCWRTLMRSALASPRSTKWPHAQYSWRQRWIELQAISANLIERNNIK